MLIRKGKTEDYNQVESMLDRIWGKDDYVYEYWQQWVEEEDKGIVLVAESGSRVVGTSYISFMPGGDCWFQAMRVDPDCHRQGVGSKLTTSSLSVSKAIKRKTAYLGTDGSNTASIKMTEKIGFYSIAAFSALLKPAGESLPVSTHSNLSIREAQHKDISELLNLGLLLKKEGFISFWRWYTLTDEMLREAICEKEIWVVEAKNTIKGFFSYFPDHVHPLVFAPTIEKDSLDAFLSYFLKESAGKANQPFEIWLSRDENVALIDELIGKGNFVKQDDYIIWRYNLA